MESNFNNREFEQFVKKNADQYRMVPSEKVWRGINSTLHTRRKWYGIGLAALLLVTGISVTWVMVSYPGSKKQQVGSSESQQPGTVAQKTIAKKPSTHSSSSPGIASLSPFSKSATQENDIQVSGETVVVSVPANNDITIINEQSQSVENRIVDPVLKISLDKDPAIGRNLTNTTIGIPVSTDNYNSHPAELSSANAGSDKQTGGKTAQPAKTAGSYLPLTIESVLNAYQPQKAKKKLSWLLSFTPTVSYRKLNENKSFPGASPFNNSTAYNYPFASMSDVNSAVTHKPDMGLELGITAKYPLTKGLKLTGGLQFNINRYDIKAFVYNGEQATINLTGGNNSLTPWTNYRNYTGYKSDWLKNFYFSVSIPVGAEVKLIGGKNTYIAVASTIQPTYIIGDRAYLLSTDYKNYAEAPSLIRHVNVNTSFETFVSYKGRSTRWQIGPQVRYQMLSSFKNKYPVRENLFDYGIKVGVSLNQ